MKKFFKLLTSKLALAAFFFLLQAAILVFLILSILSLNSTVSFWVTLALQVLSVIVCIYIINRDDKSDYKLAWVVPILLFPIFGGFLYLTMGRQNVNRKLKKKMKTIDESTETALRQTVETVGSWELKPTNEKISRYIINQGTFPLYDKTETTYYSIGETMADAMIESLEKAEKYIFMEFFIIASGVFLERVLNVLKRKAEQGVEVRIIYDDVGCVGKISGKKIKEIRNSGIKIHAFNKLRASVNANNRDHRKIVVIDGMTAFTGGINIADEYINVTHPYGHWKDTGMKFSGPAAWSFTVMFLRFWQVLAGIEPDPYHFVPDNWEQTPQGDGYVQPLCSGPDKRTQLIKNSFLHIINGAKNYVYINTPYLILDDETVTALCLAAKSGVDVRITMPHIPDKKLIFTMSRSFYVPLLKAGVKIYEYIPGFIHAKSVVSDDHTAYIGSCNFDYRSFFLHYEVGAILYDTPSIENMKEDYLQTVENCHSVSYEEATDVKIFTKIGRAILRLFAPLL